MDSRCKTIALLGISMFSAANLTSGRWAVGGCLAGLNEPKVKQMSLRLSADSAL